MNESSDPEYSLDTSDDGNASTCVGGRGNSRIAVKYGVVTLTLKSY